ncbi:ribbon-helix-helix domain-containing protein [Halochromatium glycolicum]|jgi:predicted transcriptional regulator|uniref:Toxin-antitoxin system HicB family antitoxin n=1 Tax=Halochromatium glycolicum TaxID=85075 RepID=A0AAJ0X904_9GAMM|nr:ribbon-helix-helix domain-containing protein [Halochromatium glycolicum]MBK1703743.1 toxin-antitoxin system HicB family antitoxin [Halochromatium glycolicum]
MTSLTVTLPDDTYRRLNEIAQGRGQSIDALIDAMANHLVAEADAEARFRARAARGQGQSERGLDLLSKALGDAASD